MVLRKKRKDYVDKDQTRGKDPESENVTVTEKSNKHKSSLKSCQSSENHTESTTKRHQSQRMHASLTKSRDTLTDLKSDEIKTSESSSIFPESKTEQSYEETHREESALIFPADVDFYGSLSADGGIEEVRTQCF